jgi:hypothetical protein
MTLPPSYTADHRLDEVRDEQVDAVGDRHRPHLVAGVDVKGIQTRLRMFYMSQITTNKIH